MVNNTSVLLLLEMMHLKIGRAAEKNSFKYLRDVLFHSCDGSAESLSHEFRLLCKTLAFLDDVAGTRVNVTRLIASSKLLFSNDNYHLHDHLLQEGCFENTKKTGPSDSELNCFISECKSKATIRCVAVGCNNRGSQICAGCMMSHYCSKECQMADWKSNHKRICKARCRNLARIRRGDPC